MAPYNHHGDIIFGFPTILKNPDLFDHRTDYLRRT